MHVQRLHLERALSANGFCGSVQLLDSSLESSSESPSLDRAVVVKVRVDRAEEESASSCGDIQVSVSFPFLPAFLIPFSYRKF